MNSSHHTTVILTDTPKTENDDANYLFRGIESGHVGDAGCGPPDHSRAW